MAVEGLRCWLHVQDGIGHTQGGMAATVLAHWPQPRRPDGLCSGHQACAFVASVPWHLTSMTLSAQPMHACMGSTACWHRGCGTRCMGMAALVMQRTAWLATALPPGNRSAGLMVFAQRTRHVLPLPVNSQTRHPYRSLHNQREHVCTLCPEEQGRKKVLQRAQRDVPERTCMVREWERERGTVAASHMHGRGQRRTSWATSSRARGCAACATDCHRSVP
jgi:hypothetical protein